MLYSFLIERIWVIMRYLLDNEILTLYLEGEINSSNSDNIEKEIEEILSSNTFKCVLLDFSDLRYISSAGLRIILKLKQKYDDIHIIEASLEIFDVLSMTGFTSIMDVKKALNRVDIKGAEIIGEGFFSTVYRIDKDTIIKVFNRVSDPGQIERELKLAKQAFVLGVPTAISYDIVRVDDKLGVRFEMLDCITLKNAFKDYPERYDELLNKYVELLKKINSTECIDPSLRDCKQFFLEKLDKQKDVLGDKYYLKAKKLLESIPDRETFVHGDCHFKNIMIQGDDFLLIDMDTLSKGHPIFELALIRAPYVAFEENEPGNTAKFLGMSKDFCQKLYEDTIEKYCGSKEQSIMDKIAIICYIHMVWWGLTNRIENNLNIINGSKERLISLLDKYDDVDIG